MSERPSVDRVLHPVPRPALSNAAELDATWLSDLQRRPFPRAKPQVQSRREDHTATHTEWQDAGQVAAYSRPGNLFSATVKALDESGGQPSLRSVVAVPQLLKIPAEPGHAPKQRQRRRGGDYREQPDRRLRTARTRDSAYTEQQCDAADDCRQHRKDEGRACDCQHRVFKCADFGASLVRRRRHAIPALCPACRHMRAPDIAVCEMRLDPALERGGWDAGRAPNSHDGKSGSRQQLEQFRPSYSESLRGFLRAQQQLIHSEQTPSNLGASPSMERPG